MAKPEGTKAKQRDESVKLIVKNRRATFDFHVVERYEAGIELTGTEVKSLRDGQVNLADAYGLDDRGQVWLHHCNIAPYKSSGAALNHPATRKRRLLLHKREIEHIATKMKEKGYALVPLSLYWKGGKAKVELGLCKGKTHEDRRDTIIERDAKRDMDREKSDRAKARPMVRKQRGRDDD